MKRVILVGSPRSKGRSAHLAEMLFEANIDERPEDELFLVPVSEVEIGPCIGCSACRKQTEVVFKGDGGQEFTELRHRCVFDDDMQTLYDLLDEADELTVVCPVFFSGTPAVMKCVLDRLQPYFWVNQRGRFLIENPLPGPAPKRPATLHVIGEGGDPHGFAPLVGEMKSALACAGFRLERVMDWVGKIDADGTIVAEADELDVEKALGKKAACATPLEEGSGDEAPAQDGPSAGGYAHGEEGREEGASRPDGAARQATAQQDARKRPKLDFSAKSQKRSGSDRPTRTSGHDGRGRAGDAGGANGRKGKSHAGGKGGSARQGGNRGGTGKPGGSRGASGSRTTGASSKGKRSQERGGRGGGKRRG
jgi:multimeric flavodoxin WrbA